MSSGGGGSFTWYMQVQVQEPGSRRLRATLVRERSYSACTKAQLPIVRSMGPAGAYRPRDRARRPASANSRGIAHARLSPARTLPGLGEEAQAHGKRGPIHSRVQRPLDHRGGSPPSEDLLQNGDDKPNVRQLRSGESSSTWQTNPIHSRSRRRVRVVDLVGRQVVSGPARFT